MWNFKTFKNFNEQSKWINKNKYKYQIEIVFINNGNAIEYKELTIIDC